MTDDDPRRALLSGDDEVGRAMGALDWSQTPLGPPETWPPALRNVVRILLASRFSMWAAWGPQLTFFYNDAYRRDTLQAKHPWALGRPAQEVWAEIWHDIGPRARVVLDTGQATWDEDLLLLLERSGFPEETYHTFSYSPLSGDDGRPEGILCVVVETTDRVIGDRRMATLRDLAAALGPARSRRQALQLAAEQLGRNLVDLPFSAVYLFDDDGTARLGATAGIVPGLGVTQREFRPDHPRAHLQRELRAGRQLMVEDLEQRFADLPSGAWDVPPSRAVAVPIIAATQGTPAEGESTLAGFLTVGLSPHRPYDESYRGFVGLLANQIASGLLNADGYEAERRRAEALAELDRAKTDFFSNVSHEFRTPLTLITSPIAELRAAPDLPSSRVRDELEVIERNAQRLGKLVNTLLDFARLQAGRIDARFEPTDLAAATAELASVFRSAAARAGLDYTVDCPPLPAPVHIDRDAWEKVVLNLLSNALKFTFEGAITVRLRAEGDHAVLTVADTGIGIPTAELPRLFERFSRVTGARSRSGEGSGIGLAMVKELVDLHGGTIAVESTPDVGTTFTVTLRHGTQHLPSDQLVPATPGTPTVSAAADPFLTEALRWLPRTETPVGADDGTPESPVVPTGRVLVADDNADMREYLHRLLAPRFAVETVADGSAALRAALDRAPDLVISDVMMPEMDGMALLAALRTDARTSRVPVLLLSARAGQEAAVEGLAAGADDYLVKPFLAQELLARVGAHVHLGRARREAEERQALLAEVGSTLDRERTVEGQLTALARLLVDRRVADLCTVRLVGEENRLQTIGVAARDAGAEAAVAALRPDRGLGAEAVATGRTLVRSRLPQPPSPQSELASAVPVGSGMAVPLSVGGRVLAVLGLARRPGEPEYGEADRALLEEIAARTALSVDNVVLLAETQATARRLGVLQRVTAQLSAATTPDDVAVITARALEDLTDGPGQIGVYELEPGERQLTALALGGSSPAKDDPEAWASVPLSTPLAFTSAVTTGRPVWLETVPDPPEDRAGLQGPMSASLAGSPVRAAAALPLIAGGRTLGVLGVGFPEPRRFSDSERGLLLAVAEQCALALDRARLYRAEQQVAHTLQLSLLPHELPLLEGLALAAEYLPGAVGTSAGGDWYDVVELDADRVAVAVGDVVGQGPAAAAVMGQLRSALSAALLQGCSPAAALELLDRFATRLPGALASSAACLVVDRAAGTICWSRAGHPPGLLITPDGVHQLDGPDGGVGPVLGVPGRGPYTEGTTRVSPGTTLLLYTDGLVERRGETLDAGLARVSEAAHRHAGADPGRLVRRLLGEVLADTHHLDDIAVIAVRVLPIPLSGRLRADPALLAGVRRAVARWSAVAGLPPETTDDLQLALGEALANAVEHAYAEQDAGECEYVLSQAGDGSVLVRVRDAGRWRPPPADRGFRGRGLELIRALGTDVTIGSAEGGGTEVRLRVPAAVADEAPMRRPGTGRQDAEAPRLTVHPEDDGVRVELAGDLDLAAVTGLRPQLTAVLRNAAGPEVLLDLASVGYLASAGVGLVLEAMTVARAAGARLRVSALPGTGPARVLELCGLPVDLAAPPG